MNRGWMAGAVAITAALMGCAPTSPVEVGLRRVPAEQRTLPWDGSADVPRCEDSSVHQRVALYFAQRESRFWNSTLEILRIEYPRQVGLRNWGVDIIPRRYCQGVAVMNDGHRRGIAYAVIEDAGMIGYTWGVDFCVQGLDRHLAHAPHCKMAYP